MTLSDRISEIVAQHTRPDGSVNSTSLAAALGEPRTTVQDTLRKSFPEGRFSVPPGHVIKGVSALTDAGGIITAQWIKTQAVSEALELTREALEEMFSEYRGKSEFIPAPKELDSDLLTLYPTADLHIGMLAWGKETGDAWDLDIASRVITSAASELYACSPNSPTAVLLDLGDQTHTNDQRNVTPASGHQLDVDGRFPKVLMRAVQIRRSLIEMALQKHTRVVYRGLPGNHDPEVAQMLSIAMALFFENNPRVEVDINPGDFWFFRHGLCMLCANHGHRTKPTELPGIMAAYEPRMWGDTKFRHAFSGHIHHERSGDKQGARWETLRTIAPRDAYSHQHGYSSGRELTSITYSAERGPRHRQYIPV